MLLLGARGRSRRPRRSVAGPEADLASYHTHTRSVDVSLCYVAVLAIAYEVALWFLDPGARESYSARVHDLLWYLGPTSRMCHIFLAAIAAVALWHARRRGAPLLRLYPAFVAEAVLFAVLLGPLVITVASFGRVVLPAPPDPPKELVAAMLASLGAGIYEELLFRWIGVGGAFYALTRFAKVRKGPALVVTIVFAAAIFAVFHHVGPFGEPMVARVLGFRFVAGIILGIVFAARGLGIAVYLHAFYDLWYDLRGLIFDS